MDVGFTIFCVAFLLFLLLASVEVLNGYDVGQRFEARDPWDALAEWAEDSGFTFVDGLFVDEDGNTWTPDSLFDFMVEVTGQA